MEHLTALAHARRAEAEARHEKKLAEKAQTNRPRSPLS